MKNVTFETFSELKNNKETFLVDFWAPWCSPCQILAPTLENLESEYPSITFIKVDVTGSTDKITEMGITSIPTVVFFENGEEVNRIIGIHPSIRYKNELNLLL